MWPGPSPHFSYIEEGPEGLCPSPFWMAELLRPASLCPLMNAARGFLAEEGPLCTQLQDCKAGLSLPGDLNQ